jgi:hypothetical protein
MSWALTGGFLGFVGWAVRPLVAAAALGIVLGIAQSIVLRPILSGADRRSWAIWTAVGWTLGVALDTRIGTVVWEIGGLVGFAQWLVLRKRLPGAAWWMLGTVFGGLILRWDAVKELATVLDAAVAWPVAAAIACAVYGALYGLVTGMVLVVLLARVPNQAGVEEL